MNKWLIFGFSLIYSGLGYAQSPTTVYGAAEKPNGDFDVMMLQQPENAPNPLGNPIFSPETHNSLPSENSNTTDQTSQKSGENSTNNTQNQNTGYISEDLPIDPKISPATEPFQEAKKIQATIYESDGRIYDVQSIPVQDIDKVEEPNIQPTITTYPSY